MWQACPIYFLNTISFNPHNCIKKYYYSHSLLMNWSTERLNVPGCLHHTWPQGHSSVMCMFLLTEYLRNQWLPIPELWQSNFWVFTLGLYLHQWLAKGGPSFTCELGRHANSWPQSRPESEYLVLGPNDLSEQALWVILVWSRVW